MKKILIVILSVVLCCSPVAYAESSGEGNTVDNTRTGSPEMDKSVEVINETAKSTAREHAKKLSRKYNIPEETADWLLNKVGMPPEDADMAVKVSQVADQPVETVAEEYEANKGKGWGVIAKNLGIKPGSKAFHELKKSHSKMLDDTKGKGKKEKGKGKKNKDK